VLLPSIIKRVKAYSESLTAEDITYVYYYCYFGQSQDGISHLLRWMISQLARHCQSIPKEILQYFRQSQQPSVPVLTEALSSLTSKFKRIYLLVDALDESQGLWNLLNLILSLSGLGFEVVSVLATSKEEVDIKTQLGPASQNWSLSNALVDEDIQIYVRNELKRHHNLGARPASMQREIELALLLA
jgi:hypothetical protein